MANKDAVTKQLTSNNAYFADLFNHLLFHEELIDPKHLSPLDSDSVFLHSQTGSSKEKIRDILKQANIKTDRKCTYVCLGIENQSSVDRNMPVRVMLYDALSYDGQITRSKANPEKRNNAVKTGLRPVITLVIYWGSRRWNAPRSIKDMIDPDIPDALKTYISDYPIHLISPQDLSDDSLRQLKTDISIVFEILKYSNNRNKMRKYIQDERFSSIPYDIAQSINILADMDLKIEKDDKGKTDMCEGLKQLLKEERAEGLAKGKVEGKAEERAEIVGNMISYFLYAGKTEEEAKAEAQKILSWNSSSYSS